MMQSELTLSQCFQEWNKQQNKIIEICIKKGCTQSNILCGFCKILHNDHREYLVSIAELEDAFIQSRNEQLVNQGNKLLFLINEFEQFARKQLEGIVNNMKLILNPIIYLENIIMKNKQQSYRQLSDQISELIKLIEYDNFKVEFRQFKIEEINDQINNLANEYLLKITNFMQQNGFLSLAIQQSSIQRKNIFLIQKQQKQQQSQVIFGAQPTRINDFHFLQENCEKFIKCVTPFCVRNIKTGTGIMRNKCKYKAYLNRSLQKNEGVSLVFKMNSIQDKIGIGISQVEKESQLEQDFFTIGQGIYLVQSDGFTYNNDYQEWNYKQLKYFKMDEDSKYRFTFDPANKEEKQFKLEQVENSPNKLTMPMNIELLYICLGGDQKQNQLMNEFYVILSYLDFFFYINFYGILEKINLFFNSIIFNLAPNIISQRVNLQNIIN